MTFALPRLAWLAVGAAIVLAVVFALEYTRRRRMMERLGHVPMLQRMTGSLSASRRVIKFFLLVTGATLALLALARPQVRGDSTWRQRGIDVALVMDFSKSMLAPDVYPSRHGRMFHEVDELMTGLDADRVAAIVFAGAAISFPLSHDHEATKHLYRGLHPRDLAPGSNLAAGLRAARCALRPEGTADESCYPPAAGISGGWNACGKTPEKPDPSPPAPAVSERGRAILVFTDGEASDEGARTEVQAAVKLGIDVFIVGIGTIPGELIPELDDGGKSIGWKKADDGTYVTTRLDESALRELATVAGGDGHYFNISDQAYRPEKLLDQLKKLKRGDLDERIVHKKADVYFWFLFPAFFLLVIEACLTDRRRGPREKGTP